MTKKISGFAYGAVIIILIISSFLGMGIYCILKSAEQNSYLSIIIASIVGIILLIIYITLFNYEPSLPINKKADKLLGKFGGFIVNSIFLINSILIASSALYNLLNLIFTQFLSETPPLFVGITFTVIILLGISKGINTIFNTATIIFFINVFLYFLAIIPLASKIDLSNLLPFMNNGLSPILKGSLYYLTLNIFPIYLLLMIPKDKIIIKNEKKTIILYYFIAILMTFIIIVYIIGVLDIYTAKAFKYPEYIVLKRINIFNFIDRIENVTMLQWIFGQFISFSIMVYYIVNTIDNKNKFKYTPLLTCTILLFISLKIFDYNVLYLNIVYKIFPYYKLGIILLYALLLIVILIKKKFKKSNF